MSPAGLRIPPPSTPTPTLPAMPANFDAACRRYLTAAAGLPVRMQGKRACHTGYRRTAGWTMPVGYLVETGVVSNSQKRARQRYRQPEKPNSGTGSGTGRSSC